MEVYISLIVRVLMIFILSIFTLLLLHIGRHTKSNIYLSIYSISQIIYAWWILMPESDNLIYLFFISFCYSWAALFYLFITSLFFPNFKFKTKTLLHFVPALLAFIMIVIQRHTELLSSYFAPIAVIAPYLGKILDILFNTLIISYNLVIIYLYFKLYRKVNSTKNAYNWNKVTVFGFAVSCAIVQILGFFDLHIHLRFVIGDTVFLLYFCVLFYTAIINRTITDKLGSFEKYQKSSLSSSLVNGIMEQIENLMHREKIFLDPELSLRNLSMILNIQEKYISEAINKLKCQNFAEFVNSFRVSYAMDLLKDPENKDKTMLYILFESGFNSKTTFNNTFKKTTGSTPLEFKKRFNNF